MRRREFITLLGSAAMMRPRVVFAQQSGVPVIGCAAAYFEPLLPGRN